MKMKNTAKIIFILGNILLFFGIVFTIKSNNELNRINNEIEAVSVSISNETVDKISIKEFENSKYLFNEGEYSKITDYLTKVVDVTSRIIKLKNDSGLLNLLSSNNFNEDLDSKINYLNEKSLEIENISNLYNDVLNYKIKIDNDIIKAKLEKINISDYKRIINNRLLLIDNYKTLVNYLNSTNEYKIENHSLVFLNKKSYSEFKELLTNLQNYGINIIPYEIINDKISPVIEVKNITIYEGMNIDFNKYARCYDDVDGELDCIINGTIDKNSRGVYPILITAKDKSGNTALKRVNVNVIGRQNGKYYTEIIRNKNTIVVYELDENGEYTKVARVFLCSTGIGGRTPTGVFYSRRGHEWGSLIGGVYGQYYTVITGSILIHSVPYYSRSKGNLKYHEYNKLGSQASAGCVRVSVIDAKWIYDNCQNGMKIKIYDGELPDGIEKPTAIKIDENSPNRGWDPTDPDLNNPWHLN